MAWKPTIYQRIMRASRAGRGVRLSAEDVWELSFDDAISTLARNDDEDQAEERERRRAERKANKEPSHE